MAPEDDKQPNSNGQTPGQVLDQALTVIRAIRRVIGSSASKKIAKLSGLLGTMVVVWFVGNAAGSNGGALDWRGMLLKLAGAPTSAALVGATGPARPAPERDSILSAEGDVGTDDILEMLDAVDEELAVAHERDYAHDQKIEGLQQALFAHEQRDLDLRDKGLEQDRRVMEAIYDLRDTVLGDGHRGSRSGRNGSHSPPASSDQATPVTSGSDG